MRIGNKVWSCAPGTIATEVSPSKALVRLDTKGVTIIDDGFIPTDTVTFADLITGRAQASEGLDANVVMAPVMWIMRTFPDAVARVERRSGDEWDWVEGHEVEKRIEQPNDWYGGDTLWQATCVSYVLNGNAYWHKVRNRFGRVIQLWYRPHWTMKPHSPPDGSQFLDYYEYDTGRGIQRLDPRDVVHFRFGLDPRDPRLGFAPLRPVLREMFTDQEAARFSIRILENMGIPGVVVSPTHAPTGDVFEPRRDEVESLKEYIQTSFTGSGRGTTLVFGQPTTVSQFGFDPKSLSLDELRNTAEERVCSILGLPTAVVGFKAGLEQTNYATMRQMVKLAWTGCLLPMQRTLARQLTAQLLADFVRDTGRERVRFDNSAAQQMQAPPDPEDKKLEAERVARLVESGVLRVDRAQAMLGLEVDDTQEVYLRPMTVMPVPADQVPEPMAPPGADTEDEPPTKSAEDAVEAFAAKVLARITPAPDAPEVVEPEITELAAEQTEHTNGHHTEEPDVAA